ncbi:sorting nexin [Quaeritorhiza haematococci]|nr:sorting nexin [Quaeritorhiza haematococci]
MIETVIMRYRQRGASKNSGSSKDKTAPLHDNEESNNNNEAASNDEGEEEEEDEPTNRISVCVSSQIGCKMGCTFCATGTMGLLGNLTSGEILEQLIHVMRFTKGVLSNVVFMGMGEPLDNYANVVEAIGAMTDVKRFGMAASRVCVSTVGVVPRMKGLLRDVPGIRLALSLHAPNQALRARIVPTAKAWPIDRLMEAVSAYVQKGKQILVEYILIENVNDTEEQAHQLGKLLQPFGKKVLVNLIPYNPIDPEASAISTPPPAPTSSSTSSSSSSSSPPLESATPSSVDVLSPHQYARPSEESIDQFDKILVEEYRLWTRVRRTMGVDIYGACGQLVVKSTKDGKTTSTSKTGGKDSSSSHDGTTSNTSSGETGSSRSSVRDIEDLFARTIQGERGAFKCKRGPKIDDGKKRGGGRREVRRGGGSDQNFSWVWSALYEHRSLLGLVVISMIVLVVALMVEVVGLRFSTRFTAQDVSQYR